MADILLIPESNHRYGVGHFKRLVFYLTTASLRADILIPSKIDQERLSSYCSPDVTRSFVTTVSPNRRYQLLLIDRFTISRRDIERYRRFGSIICALDARGNGAAYCDYIIDILPRVQGRSGNISAPQLLPILHPTSATPSRSPSTTIASRRVLVYFGGRSRTKLLSRAIRVLRHHYPKELLEITVPLPVADPLPPTVSTAYQIVRYLHAPQSLSGELAQADIVVTSFGLTALAATLHNKKLIILNPTRYHDRCTRVLRDVSGHAYQPQFFSAPFFKALLTTVSDTHPTHCPLCSGTRYRIYARFPVRSFAKCLQCRMHIMLLHSTQSLNYDQNYFDSEYRRQYGKSYLEDFDHIYQIGKQRTETLATVCRRRSSPVSRRESNSLTTLLDIGCAYGPFLRAAQEHGFNCYGIDVNEQAIDYIKEHITTQVATCSMAQFDSRALFDRDSFDIITMWYVIEHISSLEPVLQRINTLLPLGGVFSFSTPSRASLLFRANQSAALHSSPIDHYTLWGVREAKAILLRFGLKVVRVVFHGFHAHHYPHIPHRISYFLSKKLRYGTTFSIYAQKIK